MEEEIYNMKKSLISKAKEEGIYENFGQKEVRELQDKYSYTEEVEQFDNWCMTFDDNKLREA